MFRAFVFGVALLALAIALVGATGPRAEADTIKFDNIKDDGPMVVADHHEGFIAGVWRYLDLLNTRMEIIADLVGLGEFDGAPQCRVLPTDNETCACCRKLRYQCTYAPGSEPEEREAFYAVMKRDRRLLAAGSALQQELRETGTWETVVVKMEYPVLHPV